MKNVKKVKSFGFVEPVITEDNFVFGGLGVAGEIINPSGDWLPYIPKGERQSITYETNSCVSFATNNAIETLLYFKYGQNQ